MTLSRDAEPSHEPVVGEDPTEGRGARTVVRRSPWREVGIVNASWLLTHTVEHESWLERAFVYVALANPVVTDIRHQPETLSLTLSDGSHRSYTPDFRVHLADGTRIVCEVKPEKFVRERESVHTAAGTVLHERGEHFMVITDRQIHHNARSARALLLMRYGRLHFTPEQAQECKRLLEHEMAGSAQVQTLMERGISESLIWNMVAKHMLRTQNQLTIDALERVSAQPDMENCLDHFERWFSHPDR